MPVEQQLSLVALESARPGLSGLSQRSGSGLPDRMHVLPPLNTPMWEARNRNGVCEDLGGGGLGDGLPRAAVCQPLVSVDPHDLPIQQRPDFAHFVSHSVTPLGHLPHQRHNAFSSNLCQRSGSQSGRTIAQFRSLRLVFATLRSKAPCTPSYLWRLAAA